MKARLYIAAFPSGNPVSFTSQPSRMGNHRGAHSIGKPSHRVVRSRITRGESSIGDSNAPISLPPRGEGERTSDILPYRRYGRRFGKAFGIQRALRRALKAPCRNSIPRRGREDRSRNIYRSDERERERNPVGCRLHIGTDVLMQRYADYRSFYNFTRMRDSQLRETSTKCREMCQRVR